MRLLTAILAAASWLSATATTLAASAATEAKSLHRHRHRHHHNHESAFLHTAAEQQLRHKSVGKQQQLRHNGGAFLHTATRAQHRRHHHIHSAVFWSNEKEQNVRDAARHSRQRGGAFLHTASSATADASSASSRRPIITGCLKECGYKDQTCVTQCQVCIEQNECRILGKCDPCLKAAHDQKMAASKSQNGTVDAGGVAMQRDGLMAEMTSLRLEALNRLRDLRTARQGVLTAQREAEWASEERHHSAHHLEEARQGLKDSRREISRWKLENEKKLKAKRVRQFRWSFERRKDLTTDDMLHGSSV